MIKIQWLASIWRQNDQNVELRRKTFKTKLNYKSDQNPMTCIDLMSKRTNVKTKLNYKSDQNPMTCIDLTSKRSSQNIQNKAKLQKWSKSNDLHRFDVKTIKMLRLRRKTFKTKLNYKSDQNPMTCIDLTSKRSKCWVTSQNIQNKAKLQKWSKSNDLHRFDVKTIKMLRYFAKHSKQRKTTKLIKLQWIASIWRQNNQKCWVTSQNIQNNAKLRKWSNYNELHRLVVKTI